MLKTKEFCLKAIENGYDDNICNGWDWIRANISELDYIFQTEEYKEQKGMKHNCMPFILKNDSFTSLEEKLLGTAWYINNERVSKQKEEEKIKKFNEQGFYKIDKPTKEMHGKKIEFIIDTTGNLFGGLHNFKGKLCWSETDNLLMAMKSRARSRGYWVTPDMYVKFID